jgi:type I restriction enzyme, S subunit
MNGKTQSALPRGYKQTEIGIIPDDWQLKNLRYLCAPSKTRINPTLSAVNYKCVELEHLSQETGRLIGFTDSKGQLSQKSLFHKGDVLFGKLRPYLKKYLFPDFDGVCSTEIWVLVPFSGVSNRWLYYLVQSNIILEAANQSTGTKMPRAEWGTVGNVIVACPKLMEEQSAIATALSDIDSLIDSLEKLITKKRAIKQGAMQELMTGKRRLPGFTGKWEVRKLGDISQIISGGTPSTRMPGYWNGNINWCIPTDITGTKGKYIYRTERNISEVGLKNSSASLLPIGTLLLCSRATIGEIRIAAIPITTNQGFKSLVCNNDVDNEFVYYKMLTLKLLLIEKAIGSTFLEISKKDTAAIGISKPVHKAEQSAIAKVLSDMDSEISIFEQKVEKYKQIKQGMMQVLLTGKLRLI